MRYVKLTDAQAKKIKSNKIGLTSGEKDKETGLRPNIKFCSRFFISRNNISEDNIRCIF